MADEQQDEWPGLEIPIDKVDADILYTVNAREPKHYPEDIAEAAILFHIAGENWTVASNGWEQTSLAMFAGDWEACQMQVKGVYKSIERLRPTRVMGTECGHAHRATVIEGPYWVGREDGLPPAPIPPLYRVGGARPCAPARSRSTRTSASRSWSPCRIPATTSATTA